MLHDTQTILTRLTQIEGEIRAVSDTTAASFKAAEEIRAERARIQSRDHEEVVRRLILVEQAVAAANQKNGGPSPGNRIALVGSGTVGGAVVVLVEFLGKFLKLW